MKIDYNIGLKGEFVIDVLHADGSRSTFPGTNLIVNQGLDILGGVTPGGNTYFALKCVVGTGNATPNATDTSLVSQIARSPNFSATAHAVNTTAPFSWTETWTFTFPVGGVVGNVAEIGLIGNTTSNPDPVSTRALIQVAGSPGVISVQSTDQLIVTYSITSTLPANLTGSLSVNIDGTPTNFNYQITAAVLNPSVYFPSPINPELQLSYSGPYSGVSAASAFSSTASLPGITTFSTVTPAVYTPGNFYRDFTYHMNTGSTLSMRLFTFVYNWFGFQMLLDAPISKSSAQTFDITIRLSWANG